MSLSFSSMKTALDVALVSGHVPNIVGLQGIGKSDLVREYAKEKGYPFREVTCSLIQEGDLAMPFIAKGSEGEEGVSYAINKIITGLVDESAGKDIGILFLDEFNRSSSQVQSELMNLVLQREIVGYKLPSNIRIILAMNPSSDMKGYEGSDYSVSYSDSAMLGRVVTLHMKPILTDWIEFGNRVVNGRTRVHKLVSSFLAVNKELFFTDEKVGEINNTPRGWSRVSDLVYTYEDLGVKDNVILLNLIKGTLEEKSARLFVDFYKKGSVGTDYFGIVKNILSSSGEKEIMKAIKGYTDAELDKIFKFMVEYVYSCGGLDDKGESNFVSYILVSPTGIGFSWISMLSSDHAELYDALLENEDFASYALNMLSNVRTMEVGGFVGK